MRKVWLFVLGVIFTAGFLGLVGVAYAQDTAMNMTVDQAKAWHNELVEAKQEMVQKREEIRTEAQEAKSEEKTLREQIQQAEAAGDTEKARTLRAQWRELHHSNVQERQESRGELKEVREQMRETVKEAKEAGYKPRGRGRR